MPDRLADRSLVELSSVLPSGQYTHAQIHGLACIHCGRADGGLLPAGHVRTEVRPGQELVWAVAACPEHKGGPS